MLKPDNQKGTFNSVFTVTSEISHKISTKISYVIAQKGFPYTAAQDLLSPVLDILGEYKFCKVEEIGRIPLSNSTI